MHEVATPPQSLLHEQPRCPSQLDEPANPEQDRAEPEHSRRDELQKQPACALQENPSNRE